MAMASSAALYSNPPSNKFDSDSDSDLEGYHPSGFSQQSNDSIPSTSHTKKANKVSPLLDKKKEDEDAERSAKRKVEFMEVPSQIKDPSQLFWHRFRSRGTCVYLPCRLGHDDDVIGLNLPQSWDKEKKCVIEYLSYYEANKRNVVAKKQMLPYFGKKQPPEDEEKLPAPWDQTLWKEYQKYLVKSEHLSDFDVRVEKYYLQKMLDTAWNRKNEADHQAVKDDDYDESYHGRLSDTDDFDEDEDQKTHLTARSLEWDDGHKQEKIGVGDVIEYTHPAFVNGHAQGKRLTMVLSVRPRGSPILRLTNKEILPDDHQVRRVKILFRGKLQHRQGGRFRAINSYILRRQDANDEILKEASQFDEGKKICDKYDRTMAELREKIESVGGPKDILHGQTKGERGDMPVVNSQKKDRPNKRRLQSGKYTSKNAMAQRDGFSFTNGSTDTSRREKRKDGPSLSAGDAKKSRGSATPRRQAKGGNNSSFTNEAVKPPRARSSTGGFSYKRARLQAEVQLSKLRESSKRRRSTVHMAENQLEVALKVHEHISPTGEWTLESLCEHLDEDRTYALEKFLSGDEKKLVGSTHLAMLEEGLKEWLETVDVVPQRILI